MYIKFEDIREMADSIRLYTGDDQDTFLDTLDGETDAMDILGKLIQERSECAAYEIAYAETHGFNMLAADATQVLIEANRQLNALKAGAS